MDTSWFTSALRAEAARRRLSHRALAKLLGKGKSSTTQWLTGARNPAFAELCDIAERLGWDLLAGLPPAIRRAALRPSESALDAELPEQDLQDNLLEVAVKALSSDNPKALHFALAVLEDESLLLSERQAKLVAGKLAKLKGDRRAYLASHVSVVARRLLSVTDASIHMLGEMLATSTNILIRYRALAGFLDNPEHRSEFIHYVRSARLDRTAPREEYELDILKMLDIGSEGQHEVEAVRSGLRRPGGWALASALQRATGEERGTLAWYHALEAAARSGPEGASLLMHLFLGIEQMLEAEEAKERRRDMAATIARCGTDAIAACAPLLTAGLKGDPWLAFHSVAAFGRWAPRDEEVAHAIAALLLSVLPTEVRGDSQIAPLCCYALTKMRVQTQTVENALASAVKAGGWLGGVAGVALDSLRRGAAPQEALALMLEAA